MKQIWLLFICTIWISIKNIEGATTLVGVEFGKMCDLENNAPAVTGSAFSSLTDGSTSSCPTNKLFDSSDIAHFKFLVDENERQLEVTLTTKVLDCSDKSGSVQVFREECQERCLVKTHHCRLNTTTSTPSEECVFSCNVGAAVQSYIVHVLLHKPRRSTGDDELCEVKIEALAPPA